MASHVKTVRQTVEISEVEDVQITEVVDEGGTYVRALRVFGAPHGRSGPPIIEVVIRSESRSNIHITTPEVEF